MTFDVNKFVAKMNSTDMARSNLYVVRFPSMSNYLNNDGVLDNARIDSLTTAGGFGRMYGATKQTATTGLSVYDSVETLAGLLGGDYSAEHDMGLMVKGVNLPGSTYEVDVDKTRRNPYPVVKSKTDDTVTMTLYLTEGHDERRALMAWFKSIYDTKTAQVTFYRNYTRNIEITTYSRKERRTTITTLINAFPIRIGSVDLGYENNNEISSFEVEFQFETYMYSDNVFAKDYTDQLDSILDAGTNALSGFSNLSGNALASKTAFDKYYDVTSTTGNQ